MTIGHRFNVTEEYTCSINEAPLPATIPQIGTFAITSLGVVWVSVTLARDG